MAVSIQNNYHFLKYMVIGEFVFNYDSRYLHDLNNNSLKSCHI